MIDGELHGQGLVNWYAAAGHKLGEVQFVDIAPIVDVDLVQRVRVVRSRPGWQCRYTGGLEDDLKVRPSSLITCRNVGSRRYARQRVASKGQLGVDLYRGPGAFESRH